MDCLALTPTYQFSLLHIFDVLDLFSQMHRQMQVWPAF